MLQWTVGIGSNNEYVCVYTVFFFLDLFYIIIILFYFYYIKPDNFVEIYRVIVWANKHKTGQTA